MKFFLVKDGAIKPIDIAASAQIGSGGMGSVWQIGNPFAKPSAQLSDKPFAEQATPTGFGNMVAKIYHHPTDPKTPTEQKLLAMIARPPDHVQEVINCVRYTQFAWPQYTIKDENLNFVGYAMPELDFDQSISLNPFMYPREATRLTEYQNSLNYRVQLGANISALMADLHRHGHAFIDFKEQNLRLMPEPKDGHDDEYKGFIVGFIDCDSFLVTDSNGRQYPCSVISPEMTSPEYHQHKDIAKLDEKHDRFVLAIELFKILNYGIHPFYFIPLSERLRNLSSRVTDSFIKEKLYAYGLTPHPEIAPLKNTIHECWDDGTRALFDRAFLSHNPADRPTAQEWETHLRSLSRERQFTVCDRFPDEVSHIHFAGKPCHRCLLTGQHVPAQPNYANSPYQAIVNDAPFETATTDSITPQGTPTNVWQQRDTSVETLNSDNGTPNNLTHNANNVGQNPLPLSANSPVETPSILNEQQRQQAITADTMTKATATPAPVINPPIVPIVSPINESVNLTITPITNTHIPTEDFSVTAQNPSDTDSTPVKKSQKWWLIPTAILALGVLGYGFSQILTNMNQDNNVTVDKDSKPKVKPATTVTTDKPDPKKADEKPKPDEVDLTTLAGIQKNLSNAVATINEQLQIANQEGGGKRMTARSASDLYATTLGLSPDFFSAVVSAGDKGEGDLTKLQQLAMSQEIDQTLQYSQEAFRGANLAYFDHQPTNKTLAKQLNEAAKTQYWTKKNPQAALYLQAQAVKNYPTQAEYTANLAYYLYKNNFPYSKSFMLYALQTPRDISKYANPFMLEVAGSMAKTDGNDKGAVGSLLAQFYTADDKEKRCANMLRYPVTNPELVANAEIALNMIAKQHETGAYEVPTVCLPPYQWAIP